MWLKWCKRHPFISFINLMVVVGGKKLYDEMLLCARFSVTLQNETAMAMIDIYLCMFAMPVLLRRFHYFFTHI